MNENTKEFNILYLVLPLNTSCNKCKRNNHLCTKCKKLMGFTLPGSFNRAIKVPRSYLNPRQRKKLKTDETTKVVA